jgi:hypothetical protein
VHAGGLQAACSKDEGKTVSDLLYQGQGIGFEYRLGTQAVRALNGVDIAIEEGGF